MTTVLQTTESFGSGERRFLASSRGLQQTKTVTALMSDFTEGTHFPDGYLVAGQFVTQNTGGTYFKPADATPGANVYCILSDTPVPTGATHVGLGVMRYGDIIEAAIPEAINAASKTVAEAAGFLFE